MRLVTAGPVLTRAIVVAAFLFVTLDPAPAYAASDARTRFDEAIPLNVVALREEALARRAPQVRDLLRSVRIVVSPRPIPPTAPGAAACVAIQSGVVSVAADIPYRYGGGHDG